MKNDEIIKVKSIRMRRNAWWEMEAEEQEHKNSQFFVTVDCPKCVDESAFPTRSGTVVATQLDENMNNMMWGEYVYGRVHEVIIT